MITLEEILAQAKRIEECERNGEITSKLIESHGLSYKLQKLVFEGVPSGFACAVCQTTGIDTEFAINYGRRAWGLDSEIKGFLWRFKCHGKTRCSSFSLYEIGRLIEAEGRAPKLSRVRFQFNSHAEHLLALNAKQKKQAAKAKPRPIIQEKRIEAAGRLISVNTNEDL